MTFGPRRDDGFAEAVAQLGEYLAGQRDELDLASAPRGREFQQRVRDLVRQVPHGDTTTYGTLACRLGRDETKEWLLAAARRAARPQAQARQPGHGGRIRVIRSHDPGVGGVYPV